MASRASESRSAAGGRNPWLIAVIVSTFMLVLDTSIANVALRNIAGSLAAGTDESTWVITTYLVANSVIIPVSGWLASVIGRKRYYMFCVATFTIASLLCGLAPNLEMLIVFRILQGLGGGGMAPNEQSIPNDTFPPKNARRRSRFMASPSSRHSPQTQLPLLCLARIFLMIGLPFLFIPISTAAYVGLAPQKTNQASALINVARNIGGSIGVSLSNTVIAQNAQLHQANLVSHTAQSSPAYQQALRQVTEHFVAQGSTMLQAKQQAVGWIGQLIARQASLLAYVDVFRYCAIVTALFVPLALLLRSPKHDKR